jgi:hypothetical protein
VLLCKSEDLSSNSSPTKKKKRVEQIFFVSGLSSIKKLPLEIKSVFILMVSRTQKGRTVREEGRRKKRRL